MDMRGSNPLFPTLASLLLLAGCLIFSVACGFHAKTNPVMEIASGEAKAVSATSKSTANVEAVNEGSNGTVRSTSGGVCDHPSTTAYNLHNLKSHRIPQWFEDAKLGIFIHWGLYSVPGWAVINHTFGDKVDARTAMTHNPYAEWYMNTMQLEGSPTMEYHKKTYGDIPYIGFVPTFNKMAEHWDPEEWARLFKRAGAKYVVLTSKHHEGFTLWPSDIKNPHRLPEDQMLSRDIVGELTRAVRSQGIEMGLYYSGGFDWSFDGNISPRSFHPEIPQSEEYALYADDHLRELMRKYRPSILWNDIGYPENSKPKRLQEIFLQYFNQYCPEGVVNDRWGFSRNEFRGDFSTPEYRGMHDVQQKKWEMCRGIGRSFGYNRNEGPEEMMTGEELIHLLIDVTAKNGNLLLDVGPDAEGKISGLQQRPLEDLGEWMTSYGEAIHGTRPFLPPKTELRSKFRYTVRGQTVYCIVLDQHSGQTPLSIPLFLHKGTQLALLPGKQELEWVQHRKGITVNIAEPAKVSHQTTTKAPFVVALRHPSMSISAAMTVLRP